MFREPITIGAASGWGASIRGCEEGPLALSTELQVTLRPEKTDRELDIAPCEALPFITPFNRTLAHATYEAVRTKKFPIVLGGDHSIAVGTWNGILKAHRERGGEELGLIWIDAHMDGHTPETTPSGAFHGMGLAALLGKGPADFTQIFFDEPVLKPENVVLIGARSYEKEEQELLEELGVTIIYRDELSEIGLMKALEDAIEELSKNCSAIGVSLDLDVLDPTEAPGVGSPESGGISYSELKRGLEILFQEEKLIGLEIVEFNPSADKQEKTKTIIKDILQLWTTPILH